MRKVKLRHYRIMRCFRFVEMKKKKKKRAAEEMGDEDETPRKRC